MLPDLNAIADSQSKPTIHIKLATDMLLDYTHTYHNEKICHHASYMILHVESYAAYLLIPGDWSCIAGN